MNLGIKTGKSLINDQGAELRTAIGRLENLTFAITSGTFSNPSELKLQLRCKIVFYNENIISGTLKPCYSISISKDDMDVASLLMNIAVGNYVKDVLENAVYGIVLSMYQYKDVLEIV